MMKWSDDDMRTKRFLWTSLVAAGLAVAGCEDDSTPVTPPAGVDFDRQFVQIERLGNPLVSEVTIEKRNHGHHNSTGPSTDVANFTDDLEGFVAAAGRAPAVQQTLSSVLLPDELVVDTSKDPGTAGWLSWALAMGWGGRQLQNDVVDAGLAAIFGDLLDANNTTPCLATDNVNANDANFSTTFPFLAAPH
jgi:hypothetical protein